MRVDGGDLTNYECLVVGLELTQSSSGRRVRSHGLAEGPFILCLYRAILVLLEKCGDNERLGHKPASEVNPSSHQ